MCGLGFVVELERGPQHGVVEDGIEIVRRLAHRGATGADPKTGDGAGMLLQLPHAFFRARCTFELPRAGKYAVAMLFLSRDDARRARQEERLVNAVKHYGLKVLGWRDVPTDDAMLGPLGQSCKPIIRQLFVGRDAKAAEIIKSSHQLPTENDDAPLAMSDFERMLFLVRKRAGRANSAAGEGEDFYVCSFSSTTIVYKGLMLPEHIGTFYPDLADPLTQSQFAIVHSRFSTNTLPTWDRAHPFRRIAHNGEINTLRGNRAWMGAREQVLQAHLFGDAISDIKAIIRPEGSDSASMDNVVDFLLAGGRSIPHVMMMLVPEAWSTQAHMPEELRAFYEYHASLVEPWDGPAALLFTDGRYVGATLDRNGLRPLKYIVQTGGRVLAASEFGVLDVPDEQILHKGRVMPGKMLLLDCGSEYEPGRIVEDAEVKRAVATRQPYASWIGDNKIDLARLPDVPQIYTLKREDRERLLRTFGYTREDLQIVLAPMATRGEEATGSMGNDAPLAVLVDKPVSMFRYFKQQFAQVTNPPIDPIREELVMSLVTCVGGEGRLLDETPEQCRLLELPHPILTSRELAKLKTNPYPFFRTQVISMTFPASPGTKLSSEERLRVAIESIQDAAERAVDAGYSVLILSDRDVDAESAPIPSLIATSAVHHRLLRVGKRTRVGIVVESGECREVADLALLVGFGAGAVNPYLAMEVVADSSEDAAAATKAYVTALKKGLLKVLSKMGISTLSSYHGAQIFEALGLSQKLVDTYFPGTETSIGGIGLDIVADDALTLHAQGFAAPEDQELEVGGTYAWRAGGVPHLWNPETVANLQKAVRLNDDRSYADYAKRINDQATGPCTLRALWDISLPQGNTPVSIDEVESAQTIVRRFATGAMSFGSISKEAHENLAIAMNRIGGKSNSGEGGEDSIRYVPDERGDLRKSAIKQVASARFGASAHYLVSAEEMQIKIAQGAKPGEGGQLPGHKVDETIARVRHATPGVTLISPPPHHDIYSIEDLAELIFDLKNVNSRARVSVKLVAESGVGTVAAGVAKAKADLILISGHDGGTGASPLSSIQHAGISWEIGIAETQRVLVENNLRSRVRLQVDGQLKTGRDVAIAALLGAEEFGFATAPLVASGCIMMRKCHLNTCPVGIATQDPVLRARFKGEPEHVINYFFFVAEELRGIMASLGFRTIDEMVGRVDCLSMRPEERLPRKARGLDCSRLLSLPTGEGPLRCTEPQIHEIDNVLDRKIIELGAASLERGEKTEFELPVRNSDRALGAMVSGEIARKYGENGLPEDTLTVHVKGTAGQSFGAFAARGLSLVLEGDANDYVGKGLSGGTLVVRPSPSARFVADRSVIVGNTVLYGAIDGRVFFAGRAGERFAVRNSGCTAVVEGVGDHGCEYMTGGRVVVLGTTGRNFAAGMSGGIAYVLDEDGHFAERINGAMVEVEHPLSAEDLEEVHALVQEHAARTNSRKAAAVLAGWAASSAQFVKVIPTEYKRALEREKARLREVSHG
ncbi:glutamate synthase large subunit [Pendulispora rubella]|uniref:Glutamate synthase large subunit n=1 Tax=Pendulispora rubella TaxID=2741070 RepID=A0ABZ2L5N7_9BACT